jgi:hypothetical protein
MYKYYASIKKLKKAFKLKKKFKLHELKMVWGWSSL